MQIFQLDKNELLHEKFWREKENIVGQFISNLDISSGRASALKTEIY